MDDGRDDRVGSDGAASQVPAPGALTDASATGSERRSPGVEGNESLVSTFAGTASGSTWGRGTKVPSHGTVVISSGIDASQAVEKDEPAALIAHLFVEGAEPIRVALTTGADTFTIGRNPDCDVVLDDSRVSRRHLQIRGRAGVGYVEDLGSSNGTFVNAERVDGERRLNDGDRIRLGRTEMEFRQG